MYFGFRIDVLECVGGIVLIHFFAWNFSCDDLAEQAILVLCDFSGSEGTSFDDDVVEA